MIQSEHISHEDLVALLDSEQESEKTRHLEKHIQSCVICRQALDQLAARSEIWLKTPKLLRRQSDSSNFVDLGSRELETAERSAGNLASDQDSFAYPVENLLDPPQHPEMLGRIGRYDIEREIGRGGMGIVFKAHDAELNRPLAIKMLAPHLANHGSARKRFAQEAKAAAGVLHPNVIAVHDVSNEGKIPFIVMPYIAGSSLQNLVDQNGPLPEIEIVRMALQVAAGLTPAHSQGLVHRDIKPANILVERGVNRVIITDFGLARAEDDASLTKTGWLTGTPNYMSPEQARGERLDQRSDLFSLGSLIYFLATGRLPFRAESPLGVLHRIQNDEPTPVRQVNNQISKTLSEIVEVLLRKDSDQRFQSASELHEVLEQHLAFLHQPDIAKPPKVIASSNHDAGWKRTAMMSAGATLLLLLAGYFGGWFGGDGAKGVSHGLSNGDSAVTFMVGKDGAREESDSGETFGGKIYRMVSEWAGKPISKDGRKEFNEGYDLLMDGDYDKAISKFKKAAKYEKFAQTSNYNLGCCWALKGDKDEAFKYLDRAIELGFTDVDHFQDDKDLKSLRNDKRFKKIIERLEEAEEVNELVGKAQCLVDNEEFDEATDLLKKALKRDPKNPEAMFFMGYTSHLAGNYAEALKWHLAAADTKPRAALGNYNAACAYSLLGEKDKAFAYLDRAIEAGLASKLNVDHLRHDQDLDNIRDDQRFQTVVREMEDWHQTTSGTHVRMRNKDTDYMTVMSTSWKDATQGKVEGDWECRLVGDNARLALNQSNHTNDLQWGYSSQFNVSEFTPELTKDLEEFKLVRQYGTLVFDGKFKGRKGHGEFHFAGDNKYQAWLKEQGIKYAPNAVLFRLFMSWQDEDEVVDNLKALQELDLDKQTTSALMVHGVDAELVEKYIDSDLKPKKHVLFLVWRVSPKLLKTYNKAGLALDDHKEFISQRVEPKLLQSYLDAGFDLAEQKGFIASRVKPDLLVRYESEGFDLEEFQDFINQRIDPEFLSGYMDANLDLEKYRKFIGSRVDAETLLEYKDAGFDLKKHEEFIHQRVPVVLLKKYKSTGFDVNEFKTLIHARVSPDEVQEYESADLLKAEYFQFLKSRIPASLLKEYKDSEFDPHRYKEFVYDRIPAYLLKKYRKAGLDVHKHKDFIQKRMPPEKVVKYLEKLKEND